MINKKECCHGCGTPLRGEILAWRGMLFCKINCALNYFYPRSEFLDKMSAYKVLLEESETIVAADIGIKEE